MPAIRYQPALIIFLEDSNRDIIRSGLTDELTEEEKNLLFTAFLEDTIYTCLNLTNTELKINCPSDTAKKVVEKSLENLASRLNSRAQKILSSDSLIKILEGGADQGQRLKCAFETAFKKGCAPVVVIGCVTPTLSRRTILNAFRYLRRADVVFGPTLEGSYYLVGLSKMLNDVFEKIDWNSEQAVYSQMVNIVTHCDLKWQEMELWYDLRQAEDFEFLIRDINFFRQIGDEKSARRTEEVLDGILKRMS